MTDYEPLPVTRLVAVDADGKNLRTLSTQQQQALGFQFRDGEIIDRLPDEDGIVLMTRSYLNEENSSLSATRANSKTGLGVDRVASGHRRDNFSRRPHNRLVTTGRQWTSMDDQN